ncbi:MAG TPA: carbohydrate ABC transporter permease [Mycobacteriales bacterium]|nr:carbohydrate ABC transporter permease [Mycobacteriales bacterium]
MTSLALRSRRGTVAANVVGVIVFVLFAFPVYWMVSTAFKPAGDIRTFDVSLFPRTFTLDNFRTAVHAAGFWTFLRNSLVVSSSVTLLAVLVALLAATAVARFRFKGRRTYLLMILVVQMVPLEALVIPMYLTLRDADLLNIVPVLIATYMAFVLPFTVWTLRGFVAALPVELEEAAMIDGASRWGAFWRITFPLMGPGLVATAVFAFIQAWNEFIIALTLMEQRNQTLPVWLGTFKTAQGVDWGGLMAGSTLIAIPVVIFAVVLQGRIATGAAAGAVKG